MLLERINNKLRSILPVKAFLISLIFGSISLLTVLGGIKFSLPGTNASTDPREIFNAIGSAFAGPLGGFIIAIISTLSQYDKDLHLFSLVQHSMSAVWIGWAYKKLVYEKHGMPSMVLGWLLIMLAYSFLTYLPGLTVLHYLFNDLWQSLVGGDLTLLEGGIKLYSGWIPEIIFTIVFTTLITIALPHQYRKPVWGKELPVKHKEVRNKFLKSVYDKYFSKNFIAVRLSLWFIILFSLPLVYIGVYVHNYFSGYSLREEGHTQMQLAQQMSIQLDNMPRESIPRFLETVNGKSSGTILAVDTGFVPIQGTIPSDKINKALFLLSGEHIDAIETEKSGSIIDAAKGFSIGFVYLPGRDFYVLSFSEIRKYTSNLDDLTVFISRNLFITLITISIFSGGIIWLVVGIPLKKLTRISAEIGRQNYEVEINPSEMSDEIGSLAATIDEMKDNIKEAARELSESEEKYRELFNNANDAIYLWELDDNLNITRCLDVNEVASRMTGYSKAELMNITPYTLNPDYRAQFVASHIKNIVEKKKSLFEAVHVTKDGRKIDVEANSHFFELKGKKVILSIIRDITEAKISERNLIESQNRLKTLSEATFEGIGISRNGYIIDANEQLAEMLGYNRDEMLGKKILNFIAPESMDLVKGHLDSGLENVYEHIAIRKDSTTFPVEVRVRRITMGSQTLRLSVVRNITERKRSESEMLAAKEIAEKSNQLKSEFLAQMSHEIRSPLYTILSFFEFVKGEFDAELSPELESSLTSVDSAGKRIIRTIDLILNMSDIQLGTYKPAFQEIDIAEDVVYMLLSEYQWAAKNKGIDFEYTIYASNPKIHGDLYSVSQIVGNLVDNAIKYTAEGGISLTVDDFENKVRVRIKDTGIGISAEYLPYLFEPFSQEEHGYTRKYEGNGLGLALVKKYCDINSAEISVKSEKWKGTEFTILFPKLDS